MFIKYIRILIFFLALPLRLLFLLRVIFLFLPLSLFYISPDTLTDTAPSVVLPPLGCRIASGTASDAFLQAHQGSSTRRGGPILFLLHSLPLDAFIAVSSLCSTLHTSLCIAPSASRRIVVGLCTDACTVLALGLL